jgi:hypothetical protein
MEGSCSTGQSPQWASVPVEEEEELIHFRLLNCICSHYDILSTAEILSYNGLLFYVILMILVFYNFSKLNIKAP